MFAEMKICERVHVQKTIIDAIPEFNNFRILQGNLDQLKFVVELILGIINKASSARSANDEALVVLNRF